MVSTSDVAMRTSPCVLPQLWWSSVTEERLKACATNMCGIPERLSTADQLDGEVP